MDNNDAFSVVKGALHMGKTIAKGALKGSSLLVGGAKLHDYKSKYKLFKKTYSKEMMDSLKHVIHHMSVQNILVQDNLDYESKRINKFGSIRSTAKIPEDLLKDAGFDSNLESFEKLNSEHIKITGILLLNKMKGTKCEYIQNEIDKLCKYYKGNESEYDTDLKILEKYASLLTKLKSNLNISKDFIENNKSKYSSDMIGLLNKILSRYNEDVTRNIGRLNIYNNIPDANKKILKEVKSGSEIFSE